MKAAITLKQLRVNPREYIRLLNSGYVVSITEHRKVIAKAQQPRQNPAPKGEAKAILHLIDQLPAIQALDPTLDTVAAIKKAKHERFIRKLT